MKLRPTIFTLVLGIGLASTLGMVANAALGGAPTEDNGKGGKGKGKAVPPEKLDIVLPTFPEKVKVVPTGIADKVRMLEAKAEAELGRPLLLDARHAWHPTREASIRIIEGELDPHDNRIVMKPGSYSLQSGVSIYGMNSTLVVRWMANPGRRYLLDCSVVPRAGYGATLPSITVHSHRSNIQNLEGLPTSFFQRQTTLDQSHIYQVLQPMTEPTPIAFMLYMTLDNSETGRRNTTSLEVNSCEITSVAAG